MKTVFESFSREDTFEFARETARNARPGLIITLDGDLGAGKTVFAQGFAAGLDIPEDVKSGRLPLYHFDAYRIGDPEEMYEIGFEDYLYGNGVTLIEWAQLIEELLPEECLRICIEKDQEKGFDYRRITIDENHSA